MKPLVQCMKDANDGSAMLRMDIGFYLVAEFWPLLQSLHGIDVLWPYKQLVHVSV